MRAQFIEAQAEVRPLPSDGLVNTNLHPKTTLNLIDAMMVIDKPFDFVPLPNSDHHYGGDDLVTGLSESTNHFEQCLAGR